MSSPTLVIAESGSGFGGSGKYLSLLLKHSRELPFKIRILSYGSGPFMSAIRAEHSDLHIVPFLRFFSIQRRSSKNKKIGIDQIISLICRLIQLIFLPIPVFFYLSSKKVKVVHLNNEILSHIPLLIGAKLARCRVICHLHGWRHLTRIELAFSGWVDIFLTVTHSGRDFYKSQLPVANILAVPNGIEFNGNIKWERDANLRAKYGLNEHDFVVASIGRFISLKGHHIVIEALNQLQQKHNQVKVVVVGSTSEIEPEYLKALKILISKYGLQSRVRILKWQDDIDEIYRLSDIIVQASVRAESFGLVALEALSHHKPVIASRIGGLQDVVVDGVCGCFIAPGNHAQLAHAIENYMKDASLLKLHGENGYEHAHKHFNIYDNVQAIHRLYNELIFGEINRQYAS